MNAHDVEKRIDELFPGRLHCAEAVLTAVMEQAGMPEEDVRAGFAPRVATCFGGGVGRSTEEMCGALSGGLMALGLALGRRREGESWDRAAEAAASLRDDFEALHGATRCGAIKEIFGPQEDMHLCRRLTATTGRLTCRILEQAGQARAKPAACGCGCK